MVGFQPSDFNGADYLSKLASPITAYPFTIFAVVRSTSTRNSVIFSLVDSASNEKMFGIRFVSEGNGGPGRVSLFRRNTTWIETASAATFNDNKLHVIAARFISPTDARLYVDGELLSTSSTSVALPPLNRFDIGNNGRNNGSTDPYDGQIAEVLVYNRDLRSTDRAPAWRSTCRRNGSPATARSSPRRNRSTSVPSSPARRRAEKSLSPRSARRTRALSISGIDLTSLGDFTAPRLS